MKLIINNKLIKRNKMIGTITSVVGIAILAGGLILNINPTPTKTLLSFGALILGFVISQVSTYFITRFGRSPRFDEVIAENLDKLNNEYALYVYESPVPLLLIGPAGFWIPIPIVASGEISYDGKWKQKGGSFLLKIFGQEKVGKPELDVQSNERDLEKFLKEHFEEDQIPPIRSILVSLHPNATLGDVEDAPTPIVELNALRRTIRKYDRKSDDEIAKDTIEKIKSLFGE